MAKKTTDKEAMWSQCGKIGPEGYPCTKAYVHESSKVDAERFHADDEGNEWQ